MTRRSGITLIEALMAIFVMAIGLLALLTLFPLGAVQMAQALKDERTAETANNAVALWKAFDLGNDPNINNVNFENPWPPNLPQLPNGNTPTYPVFIDPVGYASMGLPVAPNIAGQPLGIKRVMPSATCPMTGNPPRWCYLLDDITFADNGVPYPGNPTPAPATGGSNIPIQRTGRYSFAYMARRQVAIQPQPLLVPRTAPFPPIDLTVVVYSGRTAGLDANLQPLGETAYPQTTWVSSNLVSIDWTNQKKPNLRRGSWVLDARMIHQLPSTGAIVPPLAPQGYFYRVVSVNEVSPTVMEVELQAWLGGPIRGPTGQIGATGQNYMGPLVVMEGVSEVFERGVSY
jgi:hypothetical protein